MSEKYINFKQAAVLANMEYESFRWWVKQGRGPDHHEVLGRTAFLANEVLDWKPVYENRGGNRYK